jgi:hypothetical protein
MMIATRRVARHRLYISRAWILAAARAVLLAIGVGAASLAGAAAAPNDPLVTAAPRAGAQTPRPKAGHPSPPRRPAPPQAPEADAPPNAGGKPAPPPPSTNLPPLDTSVPPPMLPRAPRERMRVCAGEWEKRKLEAKAGLPLWRDFATRCLTR